MTRRLMPLVVALLAAMNGAMAVGGTVRLDPERTTIAFTLAATLHKVEGTLAPPVGEIRFDPATGEASGKLIVDARTADTKNKSRDRTMHEEVLESNIYDSIVFTLRSIEGEIGTEGESDLQLVGQLEIHGDSHEITVPAHVTLDGQEVSGTATMTVPYVAWGMKDPSVFVLRVKKEVQVTVTFAGSIVTEADDASR